MPAAFATLYHQHQLPTHTKIRPRLCDTRSYANRRAGTHTVDIQRVYTHSTDPIESVHEEEQGQTIPSERKGRTKESKQDRYWPQQPLTRQYYFQPFSGANATRRGVVSQPSSQSQPSANTERTLSLRSRVSSSTVVHATISQMFYHHHHCPRSFCCCCFCHRRRDQCPRQFY